ncbi:MAG: hypothetical protein IT378_21775 [Sandaracinaceae bacterium]|nr:hypothetical protein [Sandaracinaceae bacterium]
MGARFVVSSLLFAVLVSGCDLWQPLDPGETTRLPAGSPERLRLLVPVDVVPVGQLAPIEVERVARQGDGAPAEPLCVELSITGPGGILSSDGMMSATTARFDLARGSRTSFLLRSEQSGLAILRARLLAQTCDGAGAGYVTDTMRSMRFAQIGDQPFEPDAGL